MNQPIAPGASTPTDSSLFRQVENELPALRAHLKAGSMTPEQVKARLLQQIFCDSHGTTWAIGFQTGKWYYYNGSVWVATSRKGPGWKRSALSGVLILVVLLFVAAVLILFSPPLVELILNFIGELLSSL
ncbi:MAG TPA: hypothetical protein VIO61_16475 [Anaerolineaceae bacterium]